MNNPETYANRLSNDLKKLSTAEKAEASRRFFPHGIDCLGANALDIKSIIANFHSDESALTAKEALSITEYLLLHVQYHEEVLIAFGIINKFVKKHYDDDLLFRFEYWLENYASNWAQVDDLCMKTIYQFLLARPYLIESTKHWANSNVSWCRRAGNVVWVKFIKRRIGKSTYYLNKDLVFHNCNLLIEDDDEFVQKSVGWLLKETSVHYESDVIEYIQRNIRKMTRSTIRYTIEKMPTQTRKALLSIPT